MKIDENNNCSKCIYALVNEIDHNLKRQLQCNFNPPTSVPIQSQHGLQMLTVFPVVNNKMICSQGKMEPYII